MSDMKYLFLILGKKSRYLNFVCIQRKISIVLFIIMLIGGCSKKPHLSAQTMKPHHLHDGTFKNNYLDSILKPFSKFLKWRWTRISPDPIRFPFAKNDPDYLIVVIPLLHGLDIHPY
jgi:hypothetical protein